MKPESLHPLFGQEIDIVFSDFKKRYQVAQSHGEHNDDSIPEAEIYAEFMYLDDAVDYVNQIGMRIVQAPDGVEIQPSVTELMAKFDATISQVKAWVEGPSA